MKGSRCQDFKLGGLFTGFLFHQVIRKLTHRGQNFREVFVRNIFFIDLDPLVVADKVRGSKFSHPQPCLRQNRGNHGGNAAFAVGSGYVNRFYLVFGMAQHKQKLLDPLHSQPDAELPQTFQPGNTFIIIHGKTISGFSYFYQCYSTCIIMPVRITMYQFQNSTLRER